MQSYEDDRIDKVQPEIHYETSKRTNNLMLFLRVAELESNEDCLFKLPANLQKSV
ncbi:hypothetical protein Ple7327_0561 [Pleurocapsa sp. PCC 7327]|nr:hypothetical protein Ple7327_0561 [Pleurocapsa sp. PCC 7327]